MKGLDSLRSQAAEAVRQQAAATNDIVRRRCGISADWWNGIADACEADNRPRFAALTDGIIPFDMDARTSWEGVQTCPA
jgi:hypothetical protein